MRILVTRPEREAEGFAEALAARGHEALLAPVLRFEALEVPEGLAERLAAAQVLLLTSGNGVRALSLATRVRGYRIFAVGDATAEAARQAGFSDVTSAGGDAKALADLVKARLKPAGGALVHVCGTVKAGDIAGTLRGAGFSVSDVVLYAMRDADSLPADVARAIEDGRVDIATFFSPRTAQAFVKLARHGDLAQHLARTAAVAISPAALAAADGIPWRTRIAARAPTQEGVIAALEAVTPLSMGSPTMSDDRKSDAADTPAAGNVDASELSDDFKAPPAPPAPAAAPGRGVGIVGAFLTGLAAAVVVLGGAIALYAAQPEMVRGLFAGPGGPSVSRDVLATSLKPLDERVRRLESQAAALDTAASQAGALKAVQDKLAAQETRLAALQQRAGDPGAGGRMAAELEQARQEVAALRNDLAALKTRQDTAESTIRTLSGAPPAASGTAGGAPADAARQIALLMDRLDRLEKRDAQVSGALSGTVDSAALARAVGEVEARLREQLVRNAAEIGRARDTAAALGDRLAALEKDVAAKLAGVRGDTDRRAAEKDRAAAAIGIAARLRQAIDAGGPFVADADLLKPLAAADPVVAAIQGELAPLASAGVTTRHELARLFPEMARHVLAADVADDSWGERFLSRLKQLVSVRRVGDDAQGATPEAILARAEAAIDAGDLQRAVAEMKAMKSPAVNPARDWLARAEAHLKARDAADRLGLHGIGLLSHVESK